MSVTFSIESNPTGAFVVECWDEETGESVVVGRADSYEGIQVERAAHMLVCEECQHYGCYSSPVMDVESGLDVNLANTNARMVLVALGIDSEDLTGVVAGDVFLGAVMLAQAADRDDSGVASVDMFPGQPGAQMIDCGLRPGYYAETFGNLHALATEAVRLGRSITFA